MSTNMMNRELIGKESLLIPQLPLQAIRGYLCFRCCLRPGKLTKCGACKRAVYCGKGCQKLDWKIRHKKDCEILQMINGIEMQEGAASRSRELWTRSLFAKMQAIRAVTKDRTPLDIIISQPYCTTCHRGAMHIKAPTMLNPCSVCHLVFTCTSCISSHSWEECQLFEKMGNIENFLISHFENTQTCDFRDVGSSPRSSYHAIATVSTWYEYFTTISHVNGQLDTFLNPDFSLNQSFFRSFPDEMRRALVKDLHSHFLQGTDTLSMVLTILAALEDSKSHLLTQQSLTIFLIGTDLREISSSWVFEELLHLLPTLQTLNLMLIGPNSMVDSPDGKGNVLEHENCPGCTSLNRKRVAGIYCGLYHDYAKTFLYQKPDLAVLFHSGRQDDEVESWAPTTKLLVDSGTLTLCTTYTEREAREEAAELDELGARFLIRPRENKWKGLVPIPDFLEGEDDTVYYINYFSYVFQGR